MSSPWNRLRAVAVASLPDAGYEASQAALGGTVQVASQRDSVINTGDNLQEIEIVVLGYNGPVGSDGVPTGAVVSGTCTVQFIEIAPYPDPNQPDRLLLVGKTPVTSHPTGRGAVFQCRYNHKFTVLLTNLGGGLAGATSAEVLWRTHR